MASPDKELEQQLVDAGNKLLEPPDSVDELLSLLDQVESYLSRVEQSPTKSMQNSISPSQKALIADQLFRHSHVDVKVAVASCISEITRITAPDAPYDDDQMKEVFQLIVSSFENLSDKSNRSYAKRTSILETVAKVRSCVVMLDLECDALIIEMFHHFLEAIRDDHPENVFSSMETIMNLVLEESEEIHPELLSPILDCVKKDNEEALPVARKLGEKVLQSCAGKVKPYLLEAVKSSGISLDGYSEVVATICQEASVAVEQNDAHVSNEHMTDEDKSKSRKAPPDEAAQVDKVMVTDAASTELVDPADSRSPKSIMNNGTAHTGEDESLADSNSLKKEEPVNLIDQSKGVETATYAETDSPATDKAVSAEDKPELTSEGKGKKPNSSMKLEEPSDSSQIDGEKETEVVLNHKSDNKEVTSSPHEEPTAMGTASSEIDKETGNQVSSPKATEGESVVVTSPSPSGGIPNESRAQKHDRSKKKTVLLKEGTPSSDDVPKKASEGTSDFEAKPIKRLGKKIPAASANEDKTPADISKKESGASSDLEAKRLKQSSKKVDASSNNGDESSLKQLQDKNRREKATPAKDATRSTTKDDKEMVSSPKTSAKPTKDEQHFEATSKSNSKRKRAPGKEKASDTQDLGENLVGSKVKVWWPMDHMFYEGVIESYDSVRKKHKVSYVDGDEEILNLKRERWEFIGGDSDSKEEQAAGLEIPDSSTEMPLKKAKTSAEQSAKQGKLENSPKKGGGASSSKSKAGDGKSSHKSKDEIKADGKSKDGSKIKSEKDNVSKNKDHTSKTSGKSADVATKSVSKSKNDAMDTSKSEKSEGGSGTLKTSGKSKQETPKTGKSKQEMLKISSNTKGKSPKIVGKSNANGAGKSKSSSTKAKEDEDVNDSTDSAKMPENTKGKSSIPSKTPASEAKSGKKRRRGSKG